MFRISGIRVLILFRISSFGIRIFIRERPFGFAQDRLGTKNFVEVVLRRPNLLDWPLESNAKRCTP